MKSLVIGSVVLLGWNYVFETMILNKFIDGNEGFGLDDVVRAAGGAGALMAVKRFVG